MKRVALLVMLLFITVNLVAQDSMSFGGTLWQKLNDDGKAVFIIGLSQGE